MTKTQGQKVVAISVLFNPQNSAPASLVEGKVYYDNTANKLKCWNGTIWEDLI